MREILPASRWNAVRRDWLLGEASVADLARRHKISASAISKRAAHENWPRGVARHDPRLAARVLYDDIGAELREGLLRLRKRPRGREPVDKATERAQLIRAHRRALLALLEAEKAVGPAAPTPETPPALDLEAARREVLARLARLAGAQDSDKVTDTSA